VIGHIPPPLRRAFAVAAPTAFASPRTPADEVPRIHS